jgi:hypothetical protein
VDTEQEEDSMSWLKRRLPKKRWKRICIYLISMLLVLVAGDMVLVQCWRRITLGPETTRITGPLTAEGFPDYAAWLNSRYGEGVTAENNAAPLLIDVLGPAKGPESAASAPMTGPGSTAARLQTYREWLVAREGSAAKEQDDKLSEEEEAARTAPWKSAEHPQRAQWLTQQHAALERVYQATARPRLYTPWNAPGSGPMSTGDLVGVLLPNLGGMRNISRVLASDAMRAIGDGDAAAFRKDVESMLRLSRLVVQGPSLLEYLVAVAIEENGWTAVSTGAAETGFLTAPQAKGLLQMMRGLPPFPRPDRTFDECERSLALDNFCYAAANGMEMMKQRTGAQAAGVVEQDRPARSMSRLFVPIHYNAALRDFNRFFDDLVACYRRPTYLEQKSALAALTARYEDVSLVRSIFNPARLLVRILLPSLERVGASEERARMSGELAQVGLALRAYQAEKNEFPEKLEALTPGILEAVPTDGFSGKPLIYRRDKTGYLLYSVGPNEQDDGGVTRAEAKGPKWDLVLRGR